MICQFCAKLCNTKQQFLNHERCCKQNPNRYKSESNLPENRSNASWCKGLTAKTDPRLAALGRKISQTTKGRKGHPVSENTKNFLSNWMKDRHKKGTAHNIGRCRWMKEPSYPESFFIKVIENEFSDKKYTYELYFKPYSLDFAWEHKKLCIEIDGEQHDYPIQKARDLRKDQFLADHGWKVLRIKWKEMHAETKKWISIANEFIG